MGKVCASADFRNTTGLNLFMLRAYSKMENSSFDYMDEYATAVHFVKNSVVTQA